MSSILDALQKLEAARAEPGRDLATPATPARARLPLVAAGIAVAFTAGAGLALWLRRPPAAPPVETAKALDVAPPVAAVIPAAAQAPAPLPAPTPAAASAPAVAAPPPPAPTPAAAVPAEPPVPPHAAATPERIAAAPTPREAARKPSPPPAEVEVRRLVEEVAVEPDGRGILPPPAGAPRIRVSFLAYSPAPERRSVSLSIDDATMVTLHEGESSGGIEVATILTDRVQVRHQGRLFTVLARD